MHNTLTFEKKLLLVFLVTLLAAGLPWLGALAAPKDDPQEALQQSIDGILVVLRSAELKAPEKKQEREQRILDVVNDMFDFPDMARSSLGQTWNTLSKEEQDRFVRLFTSLVQQRYIGKIDSYDNQKVVYRKQLVKGDKAMVYTDIVDKDLETPIVYRMEKQNGKWLVNDLKIENVSLIVNYRRDFASIISKEQFAGLVERITKQLEKSEAAN